MYNIMRKILLMFAVASIAVSCFGASTKISDFPVTANINTETVGYDYIPLIQRPDLSADWTNYRMTPWALFTQANASINASMVTNDYNVATNFNKIVFMSEGLDLNGFLPTEYGAYSLNSQEGISVQGLSGYPSTIGSGMYISESTITGWSLYANGDTELHGNVIISGTSQTETVNATHIHSFTDVDVDGGLIVHGSLAGNGVLIDQSLRVDDVAHVNNLLVSNGASDGMATVNNNLYVGNYLTVGSDSVFADVYADVVDSTYLIGDGSGIANVSANTANTANISLTSNVSVLSLTSNISELSLTSNVALSAISIVNIPSNVLTDNFYLSSDVLSGNIIVTSSAHDTNFRSLMYLSGSGSSILENFSALDIRNISYDGLVNTGYGANISNITNSSGSNVGLNIDNILSSDYAIGLQIGNISGSSGSKAMEINGDSDFTGDTTIIGNIDSTTAGFGTANIGYGDFSVVSISSVIAKDINSLSISSNYIRSSLLEMSAGYSITLNNPVSGVASKVLYIGNGGTMNNTYYDVNVLAEVAEVGVYNMDGNGRTLAGPAGGTGSYADGYAIWGHNLDSIRISNSGPNTGIIMLNNGKIGINTLNPSTDLHVQGDVFISGKITAIGGVDPPYILYDLQSREQIQEISSRNIPVAKQTGAVMFYNSSARKMELYLPIENKFVDLSGNEI